MEKKNIQPVEDWNIVKELKLKAKYAGEGETDTKDFSKINALENCWQT